MRKKRSSIWNFDISSSEMNKYILLTVRFVAQYRWDFLRVVPYFNEPLGRVKIQNDEEKFSAILHNKTSNKRLTIRHAELLRPCERISRIFIYGECVTEVWEAERKFFS